MKPLTVTAFAYLVLLYMRKMWKNIKKYWRAVNFVLALRRFRLIYFWKAGCFCCIFAMSQTWKIFITNEGVGRCCLNRLIRRIYLFWCWYDEMTIYLLSWVYAGGTLNDTLPFWVAVVDGWKQLYHFWLSSL